MELPRILLASPFGQAIPGNSSAFVLPCKSRPALALAALLALTLASPLQAQGRKKLIEFGVDAPDTEALRQDIRKMEEAPFDGCVFYLTSDSPRGRRRRGDFSWEAWGSRAFTRR